MRSRGRARTAALAAVVLTSGDAWPGASPERWTPAELSSDQYESSPTFSPDGREVVFMRSDTRFDNYRLLASRCDGGRWTPPRAPSFAARAPVLEADPFLTPDGQRLYFVSSRFAFANGRGHDDLDIWSVDRTRSGDWGEPTRLPEPVNSTAAELLPRTDGEGRLYFGSSRAGGLGQGDIYRATPGPGSSWRVENLDPPVSSSAFEYEAEISRDGRTLILLADRGDRSHLYQFALEAGRWAEKRRIPALGHVFQVGPLLSPKADRLLFAQADGKDSGELFVVDLVEGADRSWPPSCGGFR
jgi:hypothetical protein